MAPVAPRSAAVTGRPDRDCPITMEPSRWRRSSRLEARAMMAMISDAAVITKPVSRLAPSPLVAATLTVMWRNARSFISMARGQVIWSGSRSSALPKNRCESIIAASRLCAAVMA